MAWESLKKRASQKVVHVLADTCRNSVQDLDINARQELDELWEQKNYEGYIRVFASAKAKVKASEAIDTAISSIFAPEAGDKQTPEKHVIEVKQVDE